ncbi:type I secretion C-terminal target domain-containing protein [Rhizobacter sp. J219]|uniref:type I secretion C-terminal target domain-containing protein n=1 Tax=Rhizobacter sp. J219 TaxID=2898430 RepID=UPI0035B23851
MVYNTSGPGSYDLNVSVNGGAAVDLSTSNFLLFQSITQVDNAGGQRSAFVPNGTTGEGGYYPVVYDAGVQSRVYLAPVLASLVDTDGSETLAVQLQGIPVGAVLTDGSNSFTATIATTSVDITSWNRSTLSITFPSGYTGSTTLTAVATSTETATGATASSSTSFTVTVDPTGTTTAFSEIATFNADALIGQAGADVYSVSQSGTGLAVTVTQGATGSIPAQTGTETTGTIDQAFSTGAGNDVVQAGAGDDTIYLGDTGTSTHPVSGNAPTQANVQAVQMMNLADDTNLTSATTGLFTTEADDTSSANGSGNTSVATWADLANAGSGNDVVYGQNGVDLLYGGTGNDYLNGGAGIDGLRGGAGNDTLVGGAGNDVLRGDAGADVFRWELADRGAVGTPASDIIMDFNNATPAAGGDVLDLRDLLQSEATSGGTSGNLANYLHFTVSGGTTTIAISSTGAFSGGYNAGAVDQSIVLQNVDLTSGGALTTDQQIINDLLNKSKLLVDGT